MHSEIEHLVESTLLHLADVRLTIVNDLDGMAYAYHHRSRTLYVNERHGVLRTIRRALVELAPAERELVVINGQGGEDEGEGEDETAAGLGCIPRQATGGERGRRGRLRAVRGPADALS